MLKKKKSYLVPLVGFSLIILLGSFLLYLPICNNEYMSFQDALYTSISAVSSTAFVKNTIATQFNFLGQLIIAILMEIGALGFVIFISYIWAKKDKKMKMSDIIMINDNISGDNYNEIKEHSIFVFNLMFKVQFFGALFLSFRFIPEFGLLKGLWYGIFHSISAFSSSGYDIIGENNLYHYRTDIYLQIVLIILMILGSIGIFTIEDLKRNKFKNFNRLRLQTKIILVYTIFLIIVPTILLKIFETNISLLNSLFISTAARSTGFSIVNLKNFSNASKILLIVLMFIGGSPTSTAGGVRVVAIAVIISTMIATLKGRANTVIFWKKIPDSTVRKAFTIFMIYIIILLLAIIVFSYTNSNVEALDIVIESVSAVTNAGISITDNNINLIGDIIMMLLMFIGRVGPIAMITVFVNDEPIDKLVDYPTENVIL